MNTTSPIHAASNRPDLKKESLLFATAEGVGWGALIGAASTVIEKRVFKNSTASFKELPVGMAIMFGVGQLVRASAQNYIKEQTKPYVERLESELAAKNTPPDNSPLR